MVSFMPLVAAGRIRDSDSVTLTAAQKSMPRGRIHWAWVVAAVSFIAILGAAGFRSVPGVMMNPLHHEFGWSHGVVGLAMSVNMTLFGLTAPFAAALMDRLGAECDDDRELAAGAVVGRAGRCGHRLDLDGLRRDRGDALVRDEAWLGHRRADCGERDRAADLSADRRRGNYPARLALGIVDRGSRRAQRGAAGARIHAKLPAGQGLNAIWCDGRGRARGRTRLQLRRRVRRAALRRTGAGLLAAGGKLRNLRDDDERVDRHALHPGRQRPRHAHHGRGRAARDNRHPRRRRHGVLRLADRPRRPTVAACRLLRRSWNIAAATPRTARPPRRAEHLGVRHLLRPGLGRDRAADHRVRNYFGTRSPVVFGWVFASHQFVSAIAAAGAGRLRDVQGNYDMAFYLAAGLCFVAALLCLNVRKAHVSTSVT